MLGGCGSPSRSHPNASATAGDSAYGALPTFLPPATIQPDATLTGTPARPALTTEGDQVKVVLPGGSVVATVSGPVVPGEGLPYQADSTTCTWTITLSDATTDVPVAPSDFTALDHLGAVFPTRLVPGQPKPPKVLGKGRSTTFELRAVMPVGEGLMRWAPAHQPILAAWDFEVEND
jgi:hypothetical protein